MTNVRRAQVRAVLGAALISCCGLAGAHTTILLVSASISPVCKFTASSATLSFSAIGPLATTTATATTKVEYRCTKGTPPTYLNTAEGRLSGRTMTTNEGDAIVYDLAISSSLQTGEGAGNAITGRTVVVTGSIPASSFSKASSGSYSENVTLVISP